jgi:hypothetical protein
MGIDLDTAVKEVRFFIEMGGVNLSNIEHVSRIVDMFGEEAAEEFQEAAEQIQVVIAAGIVAESDTSDVSAQMN